MDGTDGFDCAVLGISSCSGVESLGVVLVVAMPKSVSVIIGESARAPFDSVEDVEGLDSSFESVEDLDSALTDRGRNSTGREKVISPIPMSSTCPSWVSTITGARCDSLLVDTRDTAFGFSSSSDPANM